MADLEQAAATITAAFVARGDAVTTENAVEIYFDCLEALKAGKKAGGAPKTSARPAPKVVAPDQKALAPK